MNGFENKRFDQQLVGSIKEWMIWDIVIAITFHSNGNVTILKGTLRDAESLLILRETRFHPRNKWRFACDGQQILLLSPDRLHRCSRCLRSSTVKHVFSAVLLPFDCRRLLSSREDWMSVGILSPELIYEYEYAREIRQRIFVPRKMSFFLGDNEINVITVDINLDDFGRIDVNFSPPMKSNSCRYVYSNPKYMQMNRSDDVIGFCVSLFVVVIGDFFFFLQHWMTLNENKAKAWSR